MKRRKKAARRNLQSASSKKVARPKNLQSASSKKASLRARISKGVKAAFARISPKERRRRKAIARGLAKSKEVRSQIDRMQKIMPRPEVPSGATDLTTPSSPGRFVWLLKEQRPEIADRYVGRGEPVTMGLIFVYTNPETRQKREISYDVTFDPGENRDEFWENYHDAARDELEDVIESADTESQGNYRSFSVVVSYLA